MGKNYNKCPKCSLLLSNSYNVIFNSKLGFTCPWCNTSFRLKQQPIHNNYLQKIVVTDHDTAVSLLGKLIVRVNDIVDYLNNEPDDIHG